MEKYKHKTGGARRPVAFIKLKLEEICITLSNAGNIDTVLLKYNTKNTVNKMNSSLYPL